MRHHRYDFVPKEAPLVLILRASMYYKANLFGYTTKLKTILFLSKYLVKIRVIQYIVQFTLVRHALIVIDIHTY